MNEPAPLTLARLIELDACPQLELFKATFGASVDLANPPLGYETLAFDWDWAANNLLDAVALAAYEKAAAAARVACDKASAPAWAAYDKAVAAALAERQKAIVAARAKYDKVTAAARAACDKVRAAAESEFNRATAVAEAKCDKATMPADAEYNKARAAAFVADYVAAYWRKNGDN